MNVNEKSLKVSDNVSDEKMFRSRLVSVSPEKASGTSLVWTVYPAQLKPSHPVNNLDRVRSDP